MKHMGIFCTHCNNAETFIIRFKSKVYASLENGSFELHVEKMQKIDDVFYEEMRGLFRNESIQCMTCKSTEIEFQDEVFEVVKESFNHDNGYADPRMTEFMEGFVRETCLACLNESCVRNFGEHERDHCDSCSLSRSREKYVGTKNLRELKGSEL